LEPFSYSLKGKNTALALDSNDVNPFEDGQ